MTIIINILGPDLITIVGIVIIVLNKTWDFKDIIIIVTSAIIIIITIITKIECTQGSRLQTWDLRLGRDLIGASSESIGSQICRGKHFYPNSADFDAFYFCSPKFFWWFVLPINQWHLTKCKTRLGIFHVVTTGSGDSGNKDGGDVVDDCDHATWRQQRWCSRWKWWRTSGLRRTRGGRCASPLCRYTTLDIIINQMNYLVKDIQSLNHHFRKDLKQLPLFQTYGDTTHTFVERQKYNGLFLPGYKVLSIDT